MVAADDIESMQDDELSVAAPLANIVGYRIRRLHSLFVLHWTDWFGGLGLSVTPVQGGMLLLIDSNPKSTQADLARFLKVEPPTLLQGLAPLISNGFVLRKSLPNDRRSKLLSLSAKGKRAAKMIRDNIKRQEADLLWSLTPAQRKKMFELLRAALASAEAKVEARTAKKGRSPNA